MHDILIKNGIVMDGTGDKGYEADVAVNEDVITEIGDLSADHARTEIDAKGKIVCPGFIDITNHSDVYWQIFRTPTQESLLFQGITTIIGGHSGSSLAPLANDDMLRAIQKWTNLRDVNPDWASVKEFLAAIDTHKLGVNFGTLIGHTTLRRGLIGDTHRELKKTELAQMEKMLTKGLREGALGFSTGLGYTHGHSATHDEVLACARIAAKHNALYATHLRDEDDELLHALDDALVTANEAGTRLHISHLKAVGKDNWHLMHDAIGMIEQARAEGVNVTFDVYPYTFTGSVLHTILPAWVLEGGRTMMLKRLATAHVRTRVVDELRNLPFDLRSAVVSTSPMMHMMSRRTIGAIAQAQEKSVEDAVIDLLLASDGQITVMIEALSEKNIVTALKNPYALVASNGVGYNAQHANTGDVVHPRCFGAFPRVFSHYVKNAPELNWENAIHKMTGKVAQQLNIADRGVLKEGKKADVLVLDQETLRDHASRANPYVYATGVLWSLINGQIVIDNESYTGKRAGAVVRK